jgi:adenine-specific DNA methylase
MTEPADASGVAPSSSRCPWCSAQVTTETVTCPSCGANLREEGEAEIPGLTQVDPDATAPRAPIRARGIIGWLSGEPKPEVDEADRSSVEPPSDEVRQEMLRIEMDALRSELEAEAAERALLEADAETVERDGQVGAAASPDDDVLIGDESSRT